METYYIIHINSRKMLKCSVLRLLSFDMR